MEGASLVFHHLKMSQCNEWFLTATRVDLKVYGADDEIIVNLNISVMVQQLCQ
jgi:hypothetical protein